jgi:hypothetical protein
VLLRHRSSSDFMSQGNAFLPSFLLTILCCSHIHTLKPFLDSVLGCELVRSTSLYVSQRASQVACIHVLNGLRGQILLKISGTPWTRIKTCKGCHKTCHKLLIFSRWFVWIPCRLHAAVYKIEAVSTYARIEWNRLASNKRTHHTYRAFVPWNEARSK